MTRIIILGVLIFGFSACGSHDMKSEQDKGKYISDFESQILWSENSRLFHEIGRNNSVCTKVNKELEYTETFRLPARLIKKKSPAKMIVTAWAKTEDLNSKAVLVTCVKVGSHDVVWNGIDTDQRIVKPNVWTKLEVSIDLPAKLDSSAMIMVYGMRKNDGEILFDDFEIAIE